MPIIISDTFGPNEEETIDPIILIDPPSTGGTGGGKDPAEETVEASTVKQMYSFAPPIKPHRDEHQIGVTPTTIASSSYRFRNNTVSTDLKINFTLPTGSSTFSFLSVNLPLLPPSTNPDGPIVGPLPPGAPGLPQLILSASEERTITFSFNYDGAYDDLLLGTHEINSVLKWSAVPINVSGPIHVYKNLPMLEDPNKILDPPPDIGDGEVGDLDPTDGPTPRPTGPTPTHLYFSLSPVNPRVPYRGTQIVELVAWAGDEFVAPNVLNAIKLTFAPGSLIWSPQSTSVLEIDPLDGSSSAIFKSRSVWRASYGRKTNFELIIAKPPINILSDVWNTLYRTGTGTTILLGDNNATRVPLADGTLAIKLTGVATS